MKSKPLMTFKTMHAKITSGTYATVGIAKQAISRTALSQSERIALDREAEAYFTAKPKARTGTARAPRAPRAPRERAYRPRTRVAVIAAEPRNAAREIELLTAKQREHEASIAEIKTQIASLQLEELIQSDPDRVRKALELLDKHDERNRDAKVGPMGPMPIKVPEQSS